MVTVNKRTYNPVAATVNGVACGGTMRVIIEEGYDNLARSSLDGFAGPQIVDREIQYCRGTIIAQDWIDIINLLLGAISTLVFYERNSGMAAATGYTKHTLSSPVIFAVGVEITKGGYATVSARFECKAASETATIADMHAIEDSQAAPTFIAAARGGIRVSAAKHGSIDAYHVLGFGLTITMPVKKACNDADLAYTAVDRVAEAMEVSGNLDLQDSGVASAKNKAQQLLLASPDDLELTIVQSGAAAEKTLVVAGVMFIGTNETSDVNIDYTEHSLAYTVTNDPSAPLTLDGDNKLVTIT